MDKTSAHGSLLFFDNYMWMQAHLNDPRDPTTGSQLRAGQLKTNIGLCNATRKYLEERPWAWGAT